VQECKSVSIGLFYSSIGEKERLLGGFVLGLPFSSLWTIIFQSMFLSRYSNCFRNCFFPIAAGSDFGWAQLRRCRGWGISGSLPSSTTRLTSRNSPLFSLYLLPFILFQTLRRLGLCLLSVTMPLDVSVICNLAAVCGRDGPWCWIGYGCSLDQCIQDEYFKANLHSNMLNYFGGLMKYQRMLWWLVGFGRT
jgi:hypothetical protein